MNSTNISNDQTIKSEKPRIYRSFFYLIKKHAILLRRILRVEYNIGVVMIKTDEPRQTWYC